MYAHLPATTSYRPSVGSEASAAVTRPSPPLARDEAVRRGGLPSGPPRPALPTRSATSVHHPSSTSVTRSLPDSETMCHAPSRPPEATVPTTPRTSGTSHPRSRHPGTNTDEDPPSFRQVDDRPQPTTGSRRSRTRAVVVTRRGIQMLQLRPVKRLAQGGVAGCGGRAARGVLPDPCRARRTPSTR
jgi:hypothetical protein